MPTMLELNLLLSLALVFAMIAPKHASPTSAITPSAKLAMTAARNVRRLARSIRLSFLISPTDLVSNRNNFFGKSFFKIIFKTQLVDAERNAFYPLQLKNRSLVWAFVPITT